MENKKHNQVEVVIGGRVYTLQGFESEEYIQAIGRYINKKLDKINRTVTSRIKNSTTFPMLLAINIADDVFKVSDKYEKLVMDNKKLQDENEELKRRIEVLQSNTKR